MLLLGLIFVASFSGLAAAALTLLRPRRDDKVQRRLQAIRAAPQAVSPAPGVANAPDEPSKTTDATARSPREEWRFAGKPGGAWLARLMRESKTRWSPTTLLLRVGLCALVGAGVGRAAAVGFVAPAVLGPALGSLPVVWLRYRRSRCLAAFQDALPEAIELMSRALQAGYSVQQMIEVTSEQAREPVRSELAAVHREQSLGVPLREALLGMVERVPSQDLRFVVTAMLIQKETGGDLIVILERTAHVIRERMRVAGEVRTSTAQGRLTGWILTALPVLLLGVIALLTPGYVAVLFHDPTGQKLLWLGAALLVVGGIVVRQITRVEV